MWIALILTILGLSLVFVEFFLPGGVVALVGGLLIVIGITTFSFAPVSLLFKVIFFLASCSLTAFVCSFAVFLIRNKKKSDLYLSNDQEGYIASSFNGDLIGEKGVALSDLKPSGHIQIEGKRYQATSDGLYIQKGMPIVIEGGRGSYLIVRSNSKELV